METPVKKVVRTYNARTGEESNWEIHYRFKEYMNILQNLQHGIVPQVEPISLVDNYSFTYVDTLGRVVVEI